MTGHVSKIHDEKTIKPNFSVVEVILRYVSLDNIEQFRYLQAINRQAKKMVEDVSEGDLVTVKIHLKGQLKETGKCHNLDEIYEITRV